MRGIRTREDLFDFQIPIFKKKKSVPQFPIPQFLIPVLGDSRDIMSYFTFSILPTCNTIRRVAWCTSMGDGGLAHSCAAVAAWLAVAYCAVLAGDTAWRQLGYRTDEKQCRGSVRSWEQVSDCFSALPYPLCEIAMEMPSSRAREEHCLLPEWFLLVLCWAMKSSRSPSCPAKPESPFFGPPTLNVCSRVDMFIMLLCREFEAGRELTALMPC